MSGHQNIILCGPTGVGKTYLACAFGNLACRLGFTVRYFRVSRLLNELTAAHGDGTYINYLNSIRKTNLLIFDDWGLNPFSGVESREILEVIEERNQHQSTIIVSQIPVDNWYGLHVDPTLADAILDRLIHNSHIINLKGESTRKKQVKISIPKAEKEGDPICPDE